ncbi:hypothetical protein [uncultured Chitinophaga sp.]|uniref:hypothetical protein n=1 Tax=uncultured Chitinophaga sp. TaxID=339340 RepID=UPI0025F4CCAA|nr:hypothetical protein [uncultured Chitinophaga sp.]
MTVYLDNNIIVSIENGDYTLDSVKSVLPNGKLRFFYSSAHIFEVESFPGNSSISKDDLLTKRLDTVRNIFKNNYLYLDLNGNRLTHIMEDPREVYDTITLVPSGITAIKGFMNLISKEQKEDIRRQLGIDILKLNNYSAIEVIDHLNTKLTSWGTNQSFLEMIEYGIQLHPDGKKFGLHNRIAGVFELLDMFGYWKDKETPTSNYARLWDAEHCFFASYCDFFISDDRRTRNKAAVVYNVYNKDTKIISSGDSK